MTNVTIANIFLFITILCLAVSAQLGSIMFFFYSFAAIVLAGMMRHTELERVQEARPRS